VSIPWILNKTEFEKHDLNPNDVILVPEGQLFTIVINGENKRLSFSLKKIEKAGSVLEFN
jgi:hypothetical protein